MEEEKEEKDINNLMRYSALINWDNDEKIKNYDFVQIWIDKVFIDVVNYNDGDLFYRYHYFNNNVAEIELKFFIFDELSPIYSSIFHIGDNHFNKNTYTKEK